MTIRDADPDLLRDLRVRSAENGGVFRVEDGRLMVFDADAAQRANADNFADLTLPDRLVDIVRRRRSTAVSWKSVRAGWLTRLRELGDEPGLAALYRRMSDVLEARCDRPVDLVWLAHEVLFRSLRPLIVAGLSPRDAAALSQDAIVKLERLLDRKGPRYQWRSMNAQVRTGLVVRRALRRARRTPRPDLTAPVAAMLPDLGMDRAVDAVTAVLTAVVGPPGAAMTNLMFELAARPEWEERLAAEFGRTSVDELCRTGTMSAPTAHRFVREVLRFWAAPTLLARSVRVPMTVTGVDLAVGEQYLVSPFMVHHDDRAWADPEVFDPDRWLPGARHGPPSGHHYVPFGWAPTMCIGAGLGTMQLVLFAHLLCTTFRVCLHRPETVRMSIGAVPTPLDFVGHLTRR
jgi:cytochrome P450